MSTPPPILQQLHWDAATLRADFPPLFHHRNKAVLDSIATAGGWRPSGTLVYTQLGPAPLPATVNGGVARVDVRSCGYDYTPAGEGLADWFVNFADPALFFGYGTALFAQDEIMCAEHPILGSLVQALRDAGANARTVGARDEPTPVLVEGAERRLAVDLKVVPYGNDFQRASADVLRAGTRVLDPAPRHRIIAMAAPSDGDGVYTLAELRHILHTAYTAFAGAVAATPGRALAIHSGFWGCGVFGGNRVVMTLLQVIAAHAAGVRVYTHHCRPAAGMDAVNEALEIADEILGDGSEAIDTDYVLAAVEALEYRWGVGDGN
jgi:hypothetical protein